MKQFILFITCLLVITSCSSSDGGDSPTPTPSGFDRSAILAHWADNIIIPAYENLEDANEQLAEEIEAFTENPTIGRLQQVRGAHVDAYHAWEKVAFFEVGPAKNENLRLYFNNYPVNVEMLEQLILASEYNFNLASNASRQGYPAIDYLLNGTGNDDSEILNKFTSDSNAQQYKDFLNALATRLEEKAADVEEAWENGYRDSFISNDGSSASASVDLIANDFLLYYEKFFRNGKVRFPVGYASGTPEPENVEAYYTPSLSKELLITSNNAMRDFFEGKNFNGAGTGYSFKSYLIELDREDLANEIISNFNTITSSATEINGTFAEAVVNDRTAMLDLHDRIQENVLPLKLEMMNAMNISVAYFDGDGD